MWSKVGGEDDMHDGKVETTYKDSSFENFSNNGGLRKKSTHGGRTAKVGMFGN